MRFVIPLLFVLLILAFLSNRNEQGNQDNLLEILKNEIFSGNLHAGEQVVNNPGGEEEREIPFRARFSIYPPDYWQNLGRTPFLGILNFINHKSAFARAEQNLDLAGLAGLSVWGFRVQFDPNWEASATDALCGFNCGEYILDKAGYDFEIYYNEQFQFFNRTEDKQFINREDFSLKLSESRQEGEFILAGDIFPQPNYSVLEGVEKAKGKGRKQLNERNDTGKTGEHFPWVLIKIKSLESKDISPLYDQSLLLAKQLYETERIVTYSCGRQAITDWIEALENIDTDEEIDADKLSKACFCNTWIYEALLEARLLAGDYLQANLEKFSFDQQMIRELIDLYDRECEILREGKRDIVPLSESIITDIWRVEMRNEQIKTLKQVAAEEENIYKILQGF